MTRQAAVRYGSYGLYFFVCFTLFCYWTFPYGRLRDWLQQQVRTWTAPTPAELQIGSLAPSWLTGVELQNVRLVHGGGDSKRTLEFDELELRVSALSALFGTYAVSFDGESSGGSLEGEVEYTPESLMLEAELAALPLPNVGLGQLASLPVEGQVSGTIALDVPAEATKTQGNIDLTIDDFALGDGKAKLKVPGMSSGITLERVDAGRLQLQADVKDGVAELTKVRSKGKDLDFSADGSVRLAKRMSSSRLDVTLEAKFSDGYKNRDGRTKALFELMGFQRQVKQATTADGALRYRLGGSLGVPRATPAGKQRARRARTPSKASK